MLKPDTDILSLLLSELIINHPKPDWRSLQNTFSGINTYKIMEPDAEPFIYPTSYLDSANIKPLIDSYLNVENIARPVLNASIGFSQVVYKQLTLFWAFRPTSAVMISDGNR